MIQTIMASLVRPDTLLPEWKKWKTSYGNWVNLHTKDLDLEKLSTIKAIFKVQVWVRTKMKKKIDDENDDIQYLRAFYGFGELSTGYDN